MDFLFLLPLMETILFNVIALNYCFKKKYSTFLTTSVWCAFALLFFLPWGAVRGDIASGDGQFAVIGFSYVLLLKVLYNEKFSALFLGMCMTWVFTQGIISLSTQIVGFLELNGWNVSLIVFEAVALAIFLVPFVKHILPKYLYIFKYIRFVKKREFWYLAMTVYFNLIMLFAFHSILLEGEASLAKIAVLALFLVANYFFYSIIHEVTISTVRIDELENTVMQDELTGLANRKQLMRDLERMIDEEQTFSVMFMDLDKFKEINDTHGHNIGDRYLTHFGGLCADTLGEEGTLYRYGGDEFVAIYNGALTESRAKAIVACELWEQGAPCAFKDVSIGYVVCRPPFDKLFPHDILINADRIMYGNKLKKRERF